jgi:hypothetical protein
MYTRIDVRVLCTNASGNQHIALHIVFGRNVETPRSDPALQFQEFAVVLRCVVVASSFDGNIDVNRGDPLHGFIGVPDPRVLLHTQKPCRPLATQSYARIE